MARLAGIELQDNWKVDYALTRISGVGWTLSKRILAKLNISDTKRVSGLTPEELAKINTELDNYMIEGELARKVRADIARLQAIGSFRGYRHSRNLPVRGQRTRRNARTKRGKRKTIGAFKKEILTRMKGTTETEVKK